MHLYYGRNKAGRKKLKRFFKLGANCWACHGLGCAYIGEENYEKAVKWLDRGIRLRTEDTAYVKGGMRLILMAEGYAQVEELYGILPEAVRQESRIIYDCLTALVHLGQEKKTYDFLAEHPEYVLADMRECESSVGDLWKESYKAVYGSFPAEIPEQWDFESL